MRTKSSNNPTSDPRSVARHVLAGALLVGLTVTAVGCGKSRMPVAPVEGKVLYRGQPLEFGSVLFQPDVGPTAQGIIQPDGTFRLSTYGDGDGAVLGQHRVQIGCFEGQRPGAEADAPTSETMLGRPLIPRRYTRFDQSGLTADVKAVNEVLSFELDDR
jgi:hypothetical protein